MTAPRTMIDFVTAEPFRPFRIQMASGATFDVGHPEMIKVGRSTLTVHLVSENGDEQPEQWREVSLMLLDYIEPLDTARKQVQSQN